MRTHFDFVLTPEQFIKAVKRNHQRLMRILPTRWLIQFSYVALVAALAFMLVYTSRLLQGRHAAVINPVWVATLVTVAALMLYIFFYYRGLYRVMRGSGYVVDIARTVSIEESGLRATSPHGESFTRWSGIMDVDEVDDVVMLLFDNVSFNPIPASAFVSQQEKDAFIAYVRERIASATTQDLAISPLATPVQAVVPGDTVPASKRALSPATKTFFISLAQAFKLAVFIRVPQERICVSWWQIPTFALLSLLLSFVWALFKVGLGGEFQWYSLPSALFHLPVLLLAAIFTAYALQRSDKSLLLAQVFLMISLAFDLVLMAISSMFTLPPTVFAGRAFGISISSLPSLWLALACFVAARRYTHPALPRRVLALGICIFFIAMPLGMVYRQFNLWDISYDEKEAEWNRSSAGVASEENFYDQPKVLARELAAVQPERKGVTDLFFIGMAGDGGQDVFMKEVDAVARLFRERFDTEGHTIRLVNNNKSLAGSPIASATSLQASLKRVAQVMNKEEDILFLFLTSHGSETHRFSLELWPLRFNELDPTRLRKLLDESGIKHKVIVVSACYSGGFINALKDDNTLVISASAPDKNSFGCGSKNDWTYFGNAYFNEALRKTYSFTKAFNLAQPVIAAREKKEHYDPSNPQMALGTAMRVKLTTLEQQLSTGLKTLEDPAVTQTKPTTPDRIEQYVAVVYDAQISAQDQVNCVANMQKNGPEAALEQNPAYFDGLNKSSTQWPELVTAWNRYAETYCAKINDPEMVRRVYTKHLRATTPEQDLGPVLKFLASKNGRRWHAEEREAMRHLSAEMAKIQFDIELTQAKIYRADLARVYNAFIAEKKTGVKKP